MSDIPLLLFAKAPVAGKVKTRLQRHCSAQQAADIACLLMQASLKQVCQNWPGNVYLSVWLDHEHPFFQQMLDQYPIAMTQQCDGDLGQKMRHALHAFGYPAVVMGCDAPHVSASALRNAHQALQAGRPVIGPSVDGGYYLLGLTNPVDALFSEMPWGTSAVLTKTRAAAQASGVNLQELEPLNDVDEWRDLLELAETEESIRCYLNEQGLV
ncbi:hypothetical protein GCM10008090_20190 [Arenicella chitinivorans]|uniref:Glycosyltransferase n=1 Tax=Arenicella chitinivorans TaxID=1329800 RepID=A0A918VNF5_9GAMM|nr:TIGR04282 family arsenosugar biosynthesis glycosyltransferase [Arenicella chitinivorans]GHA10524.1 hypothetical protein GCM10008090_20190 [Arenicella chitinivorans]